MADRPLWKTHHLQGHHFDQAARRPHAQLWSPISNPRFGVRGGRGGRIRQLAHGFLYIPINTYVTLLLAPKKRFCPSDPDTMTNTDLEAMASWSGKNSRATRGVLIYYLRHSLEIAGEVRLSPENPHYRVTLAIIGLPRVTVKK